MLVATGDGHRAVLRVNVVTSDEERKVFFADLVASGLPGVRLVNSDANAGLWRRRSR